MGMSSAKMILTLAGPFSIECFDSSYVYVLVQVLSDGQVRSLQISVVHPLEHGHEPFTKLPGLTFIGHSSKCTAFFFRSENVSSLCNLIE